MKPHLIACFDRDRLPQQAAALWSDRADVHHVQDSESFVYRMTIDGREAYLRITHAEQRAGAMIAAELELIEHLAAQGVAVARPVPSAAGATLETLKDGHQVYHACVFSLAPGVPLSVQAIASDTTAVRNWGQLTGKIHAKAALYRPSHQRRHCWNEDDVWRNALAYLPTSDEVARGEWQSLDEWMCRLPTGERNFGMIHGDLCVANFRVSGDVPTAFDFDDCCYHWHVYDMVCALAPQVTRPAEQRRLIRTHFAEGYVREFELADGWEDLFDQFLRVRGIYLYALNHRNWSGNLAEHPKRGFLDFLQRTFRDPIRW
jgi:Ser/Thr protein kinase RdoA (MazF antagonist)